MVPQKDQKLSNGATKGSQGPQNRDGNAPNTPRPMQTGDTRVPTGDNRGELNQMVPQKDQKLSNGAKKGPQGPKTV